MSGNSEANVQRRDTSKSLSRAVDFAASSRIILQTEYGDLHDKNLSDDTARFACDIELARTRAELYVLVAFSAPPIAIVDVPTWRRAASVRGLLEYFDAPLLLHKIGVAAETHFGGITSRRPMGGLPPRVYAPEGPWYRHRTEEQDVVASMTLSSQQRRYAAAIAAFSRELVGLSVVKVAVLVNEDASIVPGQQFYESFSLDAIVSR